MVTKVNTNPLQQVVIPVEPVRVTKQRFKTQFYDIMVELAADEEALVRIEGIDIMTEYLSLVKKDKVENDYVPNVDKMLKKACDPITPNEIRIRMAKLSGKILD
jgi:hypothetical protein